MAALGDRTFVVLLVDDNPADRVLTARALERSNNHIDLRMAEDGEQALDYLRRQGRYADPATCPRPDVVLLDLNMPKLSGVEVLEQLRADPKLRQILVIVLTSSEIDQDIAGSYELGANAYVVKPVTLKSFQSVMEDLKQFWLRNGYVRRPKISDEEGAP